MVFGLLGRSEKRRGGHDAPCVRRRGHDVPCVRRGGHDVPLGEGGRYHGGGLRYGRERRIFLLHRNVEEEDLHLHRAKALVGEVRRRLHRGRAELVTNFVRPRWSRAELVHFGGVGLVHSAASAPHGVRRGDDGVWRRGSSRRGGSTKGSSKPPQKAPQKNACVVRRGGHDVPPKKEAAKEDSERRTLLPHSVEEEDLHLDTVGAGPRSSSERSTAIRNPKCGTQIFFYA